MLIRAAAAGGRIEQEEFTRRYLPVVHSYLAARFARNVACDFERKQKRRNTNVPAAAVVPDRLDAHCSRVLELLGWILASVARETRLCGQPGVEVLR